MIVQLGGIEAVVGRAAGAGIVPGRREQQAGTRKCVRIAFRKRAATGTFPKLNIGNSARKSRRRLVKTGATSRSQGSNQWFGCDEW
jgi:hypothetical protein